MKRVMIERMLNTKPLALGRNGEMAVIGYDVYQSRENLQLSPINSRGDVGRAMIEIHKDPATLRKLIMELERGLPAEDQLHINKSRARTSGYILATAQSLQEMEAAGRFLRADEALNSHPDYNKDSIGFISTKAAAMEKVAALCNAEHDDFVVVEVDITSFIVYDCDIQSFDEPVPYSNIIAQYHINDFMFACGAESSGPGLAA